ncbi:MAG: hypothetical protein FJ088_05620 [Deltaproteobacteria bacterium]|nr:hypothetical protein [Deltaproteobacteria bacterium]
MTIPLYILAFFAAIGGFIGVPAALGGANRFEHYLDPVFRGAEHLIKAKSASGHTFFHSHAGEYTLMALAVVVALAGIFAAFRIYYNRYLSPDDEAKRYGTGFHKLLFNKYFVDEIYGAFLIRPFLKLSEVARLFDKWVIDGIVNAAGYLTKIFAFINGAIDKHFVDGLVNLLAGITLSAGRRVRRIQSGRVQSYVLVLTVSICGLVVLFYILKDVWGLK